LDSQKKKSIEDITWKFWRLDEYGSMEEEKDGIRKVGARKGKLWHYARSRAEERTAIQMFWQTTRVLFTIRLLCVISI
jgi:hypothetical protein